MCAHIYGGVCTCVCASCMETCMCVHVYREAHVCVCMFVWRHVNMSVHVYRETLVHVCINV